MHKVSTTASEAALRPIADANPSQSFVIAQLGQSLDGRIALPSGESKYINGDAALDHLHRLRAAVDAVVIGVGTLLADDPLLTVRRVPGQSPVRVIIDPHGRMTNDHRCLKDAGGKVIVVQATTCRIPVGSGIVKLQIDPVDNGMIPCDRIIRALARYGLRKLLVEGGAATVSRFLDERQLDRLHLLIGPRILGSGKTGLDLPPPACLSDALRVKTDTYLLEGGDILVDCALDRSRV